MTNPSKARGTAAETAVVGYLKEHGFKNAERRTLSGSKDRGDIGGIPGIVCEVKSCRTMTLGPWLNEARIEAANAGVPIGVVIHKRRGKGDPGDWFVTMDLATFCLLAGDQ